MRGLASEALSLVKDAGSAPAARQKSAKKSASQIINELNFRFSGNWIARQCVAVGFEELSKLDVETSSLDDYRRWLEVILSELDGQQYIAEIVDQLILLAREGKEKSKIDLLAREFTSTLQGLGVSRDHINASVLDFFFSERKISDVETIKDFCRVVYPHMHRYSVALGVSDEITSISSDSLKEMDILRLDEGGDNEGVQAETHSSLKAELRANQVVLISVRATDYNSAASLAQKKIDDVGSFFKIFNHRSTFSTSDQAVAIQACCDGVSKTLDLGGNHMHYIRDMRMAKASVNFKRYHEGITLDVGSDRNKFRNIINIHGMSLSSASPDIQLVNIWTRLETVSPSRGNQSNVDAVVKAIVPPIMLGYIDRIVSNAIFDILKWDRRSFTRSLQKAQIEHLPDLTSKFVSLLTNPANEAALEDLLGRFKDFELLRYRIYTLALLLRDQEKLKDRVTTHQKLITWQIHRIYRSRNRIIHSGTSPQFTGYLVENAHDFFDIVLMFCMELSNTKSGYDTFESCFDFAEGAYGRYLSALHDSANSDRLWSLPKRKGRSFIFDRELP
ncbi:hypothetical protein [Paracoccus sp. TOH]|uniref:hypothetical protein n=1 Tax=Paracoccus sp. TOH TaxID=1263728 RepID=UPI0025AFA0EB|nr:hypothetical protein [Paracoccus sp. TOH]WJS83922.1 hypothetical protein NBE95_09130 [Paracoccus sp. TOH]